MRHNYSQLSKPVAGGTSAHVNRVESFLRHAGIWLASMIYRTLRKGPKQELPKYVLRSDFLGALLRCWVHLVPLCASAVVMGLTGHGYFIGDQLKGSTSDSAQTLNQLGLQLAAKVFELFIVASLAITVMDMIRFFLVSSESGLPLGLVLAQSGFASVDYLWSPELWGGLRGVIAWKQRAFIIAHIFLAALVAVLIGPSVAVLAIPARVDSYPGGGAEFWLMGQESILYPDTLTEESAGGPGCLTPLSRNLTAPTTDQLVCPWSTYVTLRGAATERRYYPDYHLNQPTYFYDNGNVRKLQINRFAPGASTETWAVATDASAAVWSAKILGVWFSAIEAASPMSSYANYGVALRSNFTASVSGPLPAVRVICNEDPMVPLNCSAQCQFPNIQPYHRHRGIIFTFNDTQLRPSATSNAITARWVSPPTGDSPTSDGNVTSTYPSALLRLEIPHLGPYDPDPPTTKSLLCCSIDARWAPGNSIYHWSAGQEYFDAQLTNLRSPYDEPVEPAYNDPAFGFLPADDGSWRTASLSLPWLNALTPPLDPTAPDQTTLTTILEELDLRNLLGGLPDWNWHRSISEGMIAGLVTEGMARVGMQYNRPYLPNATVATENSIFGTLNLDDNTRAKRNLLKGRGTVFAAPLPDTSLITSKRWSMALTGYAYQLGGGSGIFALTVISVYALLALAHIGWTLRHRYASDAWKSQGELLLLSQSSPNPRPGVLTNTAAGVSLARTMGARARVRALHEEGADADRVQLLFGEVSKEYTKVESGQLYGNS